MNNHNNPLSSVFTKQIMQSQSAARKIITNNTMMMAMVMCGQIQAAAFVDQP